MSLFQFRFTERAEFSSSLPTLPPPVDTIVADVRGKSGVLEEVRWSKHSSMGGYGTRLQVEIDALPAYVFDLAYGHESERNLGAVYQSGGAYRLPLGVGLRFQNRCSVTVSGRPIVPGNSGGGGVYNIFIGWRED